MVASFTVICVLVWTILWPADEPHIKARSTCICIILLLVGGLFRRALGISLVGNQFPFWLWPRNLFDQISICHKLVENWTAVVWASLCTFLLGHLVSCSVPQCIGSLWLGNSFVQMQHLFCIYFVSQLHGCSGVPLVQDLEKESRVWHQHFVTLASSSHSRFARQKN